MGGKHCGGYSKSKHKQKVHCVKKKGVTQINNMQWKISRKGRVFPSFFSQGLPLHKWVRRGTFFLKRRSTQNFPQKSVLPQFLCSTQCIKSIYLSPKVRQLELFSNKVRWLKSFVPTCADSIFFQKVRRLDFSCLKNCTDTCWFVPKKCAISFTFPKKCADMKTISDKCAEMQANLQVAHVFGKKKLTCARRKGNQRCIQHEGERGGALAIHLVGPCITCSLAPPWGSPGTATIPGPQFCRSLGSS